MDKCDVCGKDLNGVSGLSIQVSVDVSDPEIKQALTDSVAPYELGRQYNICFGCWLRSLGVPAPAERTGDR